MGKAYKSPSKYACKYDIPHHSIVRLRERAGEVPEWISLAALSDNDLRGRLDWAIGVAVNAGKVETVFDDGQNATLVNLEDTWKGLYAVLKPSVTPGYEEVVMTVLSEEMVERNRARRWKSKPGSLGEVFGAELGKVGAELKKAERTANATITDNNAITQPPLPKPKPQAVDEPEYVVHFDVHDANGNLVDHDWAPCHGKIQLQETLTRLTLEGKRNLDVYKKVKAAVKVYVEVED